jgi:hypothetical protein
MSAGPAEVFTALALYIDGLRQIRPFDCALAAGGRTPSHFWLLLNVRACSELVEAGLLVFSEHIFGNVLGHDALAPAVVS